MVVVLLSLRLADEAASTLDSLGGLMPGTCCCEAAGAPLSWLPFTLPLAAGLLEVLRLLLNPMASRAVSCVSGSSAASAAR